MWKLTSHAYKNTDLILQIRRLTWQDCNLSPKPDIEKRPVTYDVKTYQGETGNLFLPLTRNLKPETCLIFALLWN